MHRLQIPAEATKCNYGLLGLFRAVSDVEVCAELHVKVYDEVDLNFRNVLGSGQNLGSHRVAISRPEVFEKFVFGSNTMVLLCSSIHLLRSDYDFPTRN